MVSSTTNMNRRQWISVLIVFVTIVEQIQAKCVCNEKGKDACTCDDTARPKPKQVKRPEFTLPPLGDNCWCSKTMIQPASLPKPCSKHKKHPAACGCQTVAMPSSHVVPHINDHHTHIKDNSLPADAISLSLAAQAGKAIQVPEAKLAYGFVRKPINGLPKLYIPSIKEENLYALANDIITLKKPLARQPEKEEYDYPEPEEEEHEPEQEHPFSISYKQLGYGPEHFHNPTFIPISVKATTSSHHDIKEGGGESDCGFKPGSITQLKHHRKFGPIKCLMDHY